MRKFFTILYIVIFHITGYSQDVSLTESNLPIVIIHTENNQEIPDEPKIRAAMGIIDNGPGQINLVTDSLNDYDGNIGIELRGSSSQWFDKKNYGLEIWDENYEDTIASILGMPEEEDWVLHGPYSDKSLLRNLLSMKLGRDLGWYASRTVFCELIINDDYKGVYVFMEKVKRNGKRVDISKLNPDETSGDDVTGGYIVKIDKNDGSNSGEGWQSPYKPPNYDSIENQNIFFQYDYPKVKDLVQPQKDYIRDYVTAFENALRNIDPSNQAIGYKSYINLESFIDFLIINEVSRNVDGYRLSTFIHKDKDSRNNKLYIGPIWDYNLAFGNADYCNGSEITGFGYDFNLICPGDYWLIPFWWNYMLRDPEFVTGLKSRWTELRNSPYETENILSYIDSTVLVLNQGASQRNFQRWNVLGSYLWPNNFVGNTYEEEIQYLKTWVSQRMNWLDQAFNNMEVTALPEEINHNNKVSIYPNPFSNDVNISFKNYKSGQIEINISNLTGKSIWRKTFINNKENNLVSWDGYTQTGSQAPSGIYMITIYAESEIIGFQKTIKL